jgi:hypothetical protein
VVLANASAVDGFRPGDFVTVEGRLVPGQAEADGLAPLYNVQRISRQ